MTSFNQKSINPKNNLSTYTSYRKNFGFKKTSQSLTRNFATRNLYPDLIKKEKLISDFVNYSIFNGNKDHLAFTTFSSSESIYVALEWYKAYFIKKNGHHPTNFVISSQRHGIFDKFASTNGLEIKEWDKNKNIDTIIDSGTFAIIGIAGTTASGKLENIKVLAKAAIKHHLPLHVDAAIGGFILPFIKDKSYSWNFNLKGVTSINTSLHKYGLSLPTLSVLSINKEYLLKKWCINHYYMAGGNTVDYSLTCSRNGFVIDDYFYVINKNPYKTYFNAYQNNLEIKSYLKEISRAHGFTFTNSTPIPVALISFPELQENAIEYLFQKGWGVSVHKNNGHQAIRLVIKNHHSKKMVKNFIQDLDQYRNYQVKN